jgi:predicted enzyme related to lactoylglutathione lyase
MFENSHAFSGMSAPDTEAARAFYADVLGLEVSDGAMGGIIDVTLPQNSGHVIIYPKPNHEPATFTVLNFEVDDIDATVDALVAKGVTMRRYDGMNQDERGISRGKASGQGPDIVWFTDPAGNILSALSS